MRKQHLIRSQLLIYFMKITHKTPMKEMWNCGFDECTVIKNINLQYTISNPIKQLHIYFLFSCFSVVVVVVVVASYSLLPVTQTNENNFHSINFKNTWGTIKWWKVCWQLHNCFSELFLLFSGFNSSIFLVTSVEAHFHDKYKTFTK